MKYRISHVETIVRVYEVEAESISRAEAMIGPVCVERKEVFGATLLQAFGSSDLVSVAYDPKERESTPDDGPSQNRYRNLYDELRDQLPCHD